MSDGPGGQVFDRQDHGEGETEDQHGERRGCVYVALELAEAGLYRGTGILAGDRRSESEMMKVLETRRLVLRRMESRDLDSLYALYSDPEVRRYFPEGTLNREETRAELEWFLNGHPDDPNLGLWATIHKETDRFIGRCGLLPWTIDDRPEVEVAYLLARRYWGQGLGTEVAQAILDYGFEQLHLSRLICLIDSTNLASIKVAEKIGMTFEKEGTDDMGPFLLYSRSKPFASGAS